MASRISEEVLIQAILDAARVSVSDDNPHGAIPCRELAKAMGRDRGWVMNQIHKLLDAKVVGITELQFIKIGGMRYRTPAYYMLDGDNLENATRG